MELNKIINGDCLEVLKTIPDKFVNCCVTSPPYWGLRDYGVDGQLGLEPTPEEYIEKMVNVFREVRRVLKDDGTLWLNIGDSYAHPNTGGNGATGGRDKSTLQSSMPPKNTTPVKKHMPVNLKPKDLVGIPWMLAFALRADGWYLRQDIIWHKPNPMPESVTDRCTKSHEYIFLLSKSQKYYYDNNAISEESSWDGKSGAKNYDWKNDGRTSNENQKATGTRNKRSVWTVNTKPFKKAHFATFPEKLIEPCILAGCPKDGIVLDPFIGSGTTGKVSRKYHRNFIGIDINSTYIDEIADDRTGSVQPVLEIML